MLRLTSRVIYRLKNFFLQRKLKNEKSLEDKFTSIYKFTNTLGIESVSGEGSTVEYTKILRETLEDICVKFEINSLLDAPCGDFNWMSIFLKNKSLKYTGIDIVPDLIARNQRFASENITFISGDITSCFLPKADLMICRDALFHLSHKNAMLVFKNFIKSDIKFLLVNHHIVNSPNSDIYNGGFRFINLLNPPYNLYHPIYSFVETHPKEKHQKEMLLYSKGQLESLLNN